MWEAHDDRECDAQLEAERIAVLDMLGEEMEVEWAAAFAEAMQQYENGLDYESA